MYARCNAILRFWIMKKIHTRVCIKKLYIFFLNKNQNVNFFINYLIKEESCLILMALIWIKIL